MDQTTSAVGGFVTIDFNDFENPIVKQVSSDFAASGYSLVIVDTRGDHADLNLDWVYRRCLKSPDEIREMFQKYGKNAIKKFDKENKQNYEECFVYKHNGL